jgi:alanine dehydrogenase
VTVRILSRADVQAALSMSLAIDAMRLAFARLSAGEANVPLRTSITTSAHEGLTLFMPAYLPEDGALGCKIVSVRPRNRDVGLPPVDALVILVDEATGRPLAALEGALLTALRTGAASGVATDLLARPDSHVLACFGAGTQAETQVEAVCTVRAIERVWVRSRSDESARHFAARMKGRGSVPTDVRVASSSSEALAEADVVCTATTSRAPVFDGGDLKPGAHVNAVGSYTPEMQEVDTETLRRARIVVDARAGCAREAGDLLIAHKQGAIGAPETWAELGELLLGKCVGRRSGEEITYFKSVGNAVQDVLAAHLALREAQRMGLGVEVPLTDG